MERLSNGSNGPGVPRSPETRGRPSRQPSADPASPFRRGGTEELRLPRVALVCPSVGQTRRGYERFVSDLFEVIGEELSLTLIGGAGTRSERQIVVPHLRREGWMKRVSRGRARRLRHALEFASFSAALAPILLLERFDLVHFIDPELARPLHRLRAATRGRFALLFTNAGPISYEASRWVDHVHCLTPAAEREAIGAGVPAARLSTIPVGFRRERFAQPSLTREEARQRLDIPAGAFVVLSVTSLNRHHKRVDYLIEEMARVEGEPILWVDGSAEPDGDPSLLELGRRLLGGRFRHSHLPSSRVGELMRAADLMVSSALHESFGMAVVEALIAGTPVLTHDSPHFRWLAGDAAMRADLSVPGGLAAAVERFRANPVVPPPDAASHLGWNALAPVYRDLYERVALSRAAAGRSVPASPEAIEPLPMTPKEG